MKKLLAIALFCLPASASAEHMDVIQVQLNDGCSVARYVEITADFNAQWAKDHGYRAEIAVPLQSQDLASIFWIGRSANAQAFGAAWDAWRDALPDSKSVAAKLNARFEKCGVNQDRSGYDVY